MLNTSLALRYARAIYKISVSLGKARKVADDLNAIAHCIDTSSDLKRVLYHPAITPAEKMKVLNELFAKQCESVSLKFMEFLIDKKRIFYCSVISQCVSALLDEHENRVIVKVESFQQVPGEALKKIKERLAKNLGKDIELTTNVVPSLMGGMRIILGDMVIDGSIAYRLKRLSETMTEF
jgi:F-type H+-transporting ATPase subunit delta